LRKLSELSDISTLESLSQDELTFRAIQVSQIMALECWVLKGQVPQENQESIKLVESLEKHVMEIGKIVKRLREGSQKESSFA
jgi:hypothetical protein